MSRVDSARIAARKALDAAEAAGPRRAADQGLGRRLRRLLPLRRRPAVGGRGRRHGGHPAGRLDARRRGHRRRRRARHRHGLHRRAALPALRVLPSPLWGGSDPRSGAGCGVSESNFTPYPARCARRPSPQGEGESLLHLIRRIGRAQQHQKPDDKEGDDHRHAEPRRATGRRDTWPPGTVRENSSPGPTAHRCRNSVPPRRPTTLRAM